LQLKILVDQIQQFDNFVFQACGGNNIATSSANSILSPNWPQNYDNDLSCQWLITTEASSRIEIVFEEINLEEDYDYLVGCKNFDQKK